MNALLPEIGVALLLFSFFCYARATSREASRLTHALDELLTEKNRSSKRITLRGFQSNLLRPLAERLQALSFRLDVLEGQRSTSLSLMDFALPQPATEPMANTASTSSSHTSTQSFLNFIQDKFSCKSAVAILMTNGKPEVIAVSPRNSTVENSLRLHYLEFLLGNEDGQFGLSLVSDANPFERTLSTFGFQSFVARPLEVRGTGETRRGILWLGYRHDAPPSEMEIRRSESLADALSYHTSSTQLLESASDKAFRATTLEKQKSEFFTFISHDIKSPLHNVTAILHLLELQQPSPEGEELIDAALTNCSRLSELVEDVISFSQFQAGCLTPSLRVCEVSELTLEIAESYKVAARIKGLGLLFEAPDEPLFCKIDRRYFKRILSNLVSNAIKYSHTGSIIIALSKAKNFINICVKDSGRGMTAEQLSRAFIPFSRFDGSQDGSGLGLPLSKILAEQNQGTLTATSSPGKGSRFCLSIPEVVNTDYSPTSALPKKTHLILNSSSILPVVLVVDDDAEAVESICRGLEVEGWLPEGAFSVEDAVRKIRSDFYPVIITDLNMPGGGAHTILKELVNHEKQSEVIILSGQSQPSLEPLPYPATYLEKPLLASDLSRELCRLLPGLKK